MALALEGIRILDLTRVLAGPYATMMLGDMGADIIKVELPGKGDDSRGFGPYINGESAYFMSLNRNKRSITLNLKSGKGKEILKKLIRESDVVVENFKPGTMERLGLGYDVLKDINEKLIYASSSGFGQTGPYSKKPAYDGIIQAMGGIMSITGQEGGEPTRVGPSIGDISAGLFTAIGILTALVNRGKTGVGQMVDVAMLDCQVAILENAIARYHITGEVPKPLGNRHSSIVPFEPFQTTDGKLMIAVGNDSLWVKFCKCIGLTELIDDIRFSTNKSRNENYDILKGILSERLVQKSTREWQLAFDEGGVPSSPINSIDAVVENEQILAREMLVDIDHPVAGHFLIPGIPIKLSETPGKIYRPAPLLGQHTDEILTDVLKLSPKEIEVLKKEGVI